MTGTTFVVIDCEPQSRASVARRFDRERVVSVSRANELSDRWPEQACLLVRDLDRQLNEVFLVLETAGLSCPVIAFGDNFQIERLVELCERGVQGYLDTSRSEIQPQTLVHRLEQANLAMAARRRSLAGALSMVRLS